MFFLRYKKLIWPRVKGSNLQKKVVNFDYECSQTGETGLPFFTCQLGHYSLTRKDHRDDDGGLQGQFSWMFFRPKI